MTVTIDKATGKSPVACECGWAGSESGDGLWIYDRWITDYPPIPYTGPIIEFYTSRYGDPDDRVSECPECGEYLTPEGVVPREVAA